MLERGNVVAVTGTGTGTKSRKQCDCIGPYNVIVAVTGRPAVRRTAVRQCEVQCRHDDDSDDIAAANEQPLMAHHTAVRSPTSTPGEGSFHPALARSSLPAETRIRSPLSPARSLLTYTTLDLTMLATKFAFLTAFFFLIVATVGKAEKSDPHGALLLGHCKSFIFLLLSRSSL